MSLSRDDYAKSAEALIVSLARNGDRGAFEELVRRRGAWIRNLMRRFSGDATLADDLAQQVFLQAWRNIRRLQRPSRFGGWLKRVAVNVWLQYLRKHDPLRHADEHDDDAQTTTDKTGVAMDLDNALRELADDVRTCIVLSYHERMTHAEIAAATNIPLGTVKSHIRRGTTRLKELLRAYDSGAPTEDAP